MVAEVFKIPVFSEISTRIAEFKLQIANDFNIFFFKLLGIIGKLLISEKIKLQFIIYIVVDLFIPFKTFKYQFRNLRKFLF